MRLPLASLFLLAAPLSPALAQTDPVGRFNHGGGEVATVHSGNTGTLLFRLDAPFGPQFWGDAIVRLADETGGGLSEIAALGACAIDCEPPDPLPN